MKKYPAGILAWILGLALVWTAVAALAEPGADIGRMPREAIVSFRPEAARNETEMRRTLDGILGTAYELVSPIWVDEDLVLGLVRSEAFETDELIGLLAADESVLCAEENRVRKPQRYDGDGNYTYRLNDPLSPCEYYLNPPGAENLEGERARTWGLPADQTISTRAAGLWPEDESAGDEVVVAVVDSGINLEHEDLKEMLWHNPGIPGLDGSAGDVGYNYLEGSSNVTDTIGHGTHVAGSIAAAANNGKGIAGVASGIKVRIMMLATAPSRMDADPDLSNDYAFIQSLNYVLQAKKAGVNVVAVNNSWTAGPSSYLYDELLTRMGEAGIVNFIAAENSAVDLDAVTSGPADSDVVSTVTVGACDIAGNPAGFSNYGISSVDVFAPGLNILSTYGGPSYLPNFLTAGERDETTEFYGQFSQNTPISDDKTTVTPETGTGAQAQPAGETGVKHFSAMVFRRQVNEDMAAEYPVDTAIDTHVELSIDPGKALTTDAALKITIWNPQPGENYYLYFPYTKNPETTGIDNTLFSILAWRGYQEGDSESAVWAGEVIEHVNGSCEIYGDVDEFGNDRKGAGMLSHIHQSMDETQGGLDTLIPASQLQEGDRVGLGFCVAPSVPMGAEAPSYAPIHLYIDSLGVSRPNASGATAKNAYEFMSGTSMASPVAAACYALIAAEHPRREGQSGTDYVRETLAKFLGCVRRTAALEDKCSTGGYIDLSLLEKQNPAIVETISDIEGNTLTLYGQRLTEDDTLSVRNLRTGGITALPAAGMTLTYSEAGDRLVIEQAEPLFNTYSQLLLSRNGTIRASKAYYLVRGQAAPEVICRQPTDEYSLSLLADEARENLYAFDTQKGSLFAWNGQGFSARPMTPLPERVRARLLEEGWTPEQISGTSFDIQVFSARTESLLPAHENNRIYDLAEVRYIREDGSEQKWAYLASMPYTSLSPVWELTKIETYEDLLRSGGLENSPPDSLSVLNGKLCLFGGSWSPAPLTYALTLDPQTGQWSREGNLNGVALSKARIIRENGKLYLMYAQQGSQERMSPGVYCFDGTVWTSLQELKYVGRDMSDEHGDYGRIAAACAAVDGHLMMMDCSVEGGGSYFVYDPETGECVPLYLTTRDGKADSLKHVSAAMAGDYVYMLRNKQAFGDREFENELIRIPYGGLYRLDRPVYEYRPGSQDASVMTAARTSPEVPVMTANRTFPQALPMTAKRSSLDRLTFDRFRSLLIDGKTVDPGDYTVSRGSAVLMLSPAFLRTLAPGRHSVLVRFIDGTAKAELLVETSPEPRALPPTGDAAELGRWIACALAGAMLLMVLRRTGNPRGRRRSHPGR